MPEDGGRCCSLPTACDWGGCSGVIQFEEGQMEVFQLLPGYCSIAVTGGLQAELFIVIRNEQSIKKLDVFKATYSSVSPTHSVSVSLIAVHTHAHQMVAR